MLQLTLSSLALPALLDLGVRRPTGGSTGPTPVFAFLKYSCQSNLRHLLDHAWYMEDGALAGPWTALCRALPILRSEGPALGIFNNLPQCEVFSSHSLDLFSSSMMSSDKPNLVIIGAPIGSKEFCSSFVSN